MKILPSRGRASVPQKDLNDRYRKHRFDRKEKAPEGQVLFRIFCFGMVEVFGRSLVEGILRGRFFEECFQWKRLLVYFPLFRLRFQLKESLHPVAAPRYHAPQCCLT
jgi:hypothetical protein